MKDINKIVREMCEIDDVLQRSEHLYVDFLEDAKLGYKARGLGQPIITTCRFGHNYYRDVKKVPMCATCLYTWCIGLCLMLGIVLLSVFIKVWL